MSRVSGKNSSLYMEFKDTKNVTLDDYPAIRSRDERLYLGKKNVIYSSSVISNILATKLGIVYLESTGTLYFGASSSCQLFIPKSADDKNQTTERQLYEFGNRIVVMPDKVVITPRITEDSVEFETVGIENTYTSQSLEGGTFEELPSIQKVTRNTSIEPAGYYRQNFAMNLLDDEAQKDQAYTNFYSELKLGDVLEDTGTTPSTVYMVTEIKSGEKYKDYCNSRLVVLTLIYNTYTKISRQGIGKGFSADDWVRVSGITDAENLNSSHKILECGENYIILNCDVEKSLEYSGTVTVERKLPDELDFLVCSDNRMWGCSSKNNRIYASRLGDVRNWEAYGDGISTDSYWVDVSSEGDFTGAQVSSGAVYFFKENCIHRIIGTKPRNYTLTDYEDLGVKKGSHRSAIWIKDRMFYHSPVGVCVYSPGGEPQIISESAFGKNRYSDAVAGKHMDKYYISLKNTLSGEYELYVFDTNCSQWLKEDNERFSSTVTYNNLLYFSNNETGYIGCVGGGEDNLLKRSFSDYDVSIGENNIGELIEGTEIILGDIDGDGVVSYSDIKALQHYFVNKDSYEEAEKIRIETAGDVNADGVVNSDDVTFLQKWFDIPELYNEERVEFLLESGDLYDLYPDKKYIQKIEICAELFPMSEMNIAVSKDGGPFETRSTFYAGRKREINIPMYPGRCEHFRIKLYGRGHFILYGITLTTEGGGR